MVTDDGILEKEDIYVLARMKDFASNEEVVNFAAAKQLLILIERAVRVILLLQHKASDMWTFSNEAAMHLSRSALSLLPRQRRFFHGTPRS